jgi:hypothetical protein
MRREGEMARAGARPEMRNCASENAQSRLLQRSQIYCTASRRNALGTAARRAYCFDTSAWEETTMRWNTNHREHDPRYIDLMAVLALLILIVAAYRFYTGTPSVSSATGFIVPSQSVRW